MRYEDLIESLRTESLYSEKASLEIMDLCMEAAAAIEASQIENQALRNAANGFRAENEVLRKNLARVTAERDAAVDADKAIIWLEDYVFEDSREVYTNSAQLVPYFRVLQALRDKAYNGLQEGHP